MTGVNDAGNNFIASVVDTGQKFINRVGIDDTGRNQMELPPFIS